MKLDHNSRFFQDKNGKNIFPIGCNYWPSSTAIRMWRDWKPAELENDLKTMKRLGMNACRFFLFLPDFLPTHQRVDPEMLSRLQEFIDFCERQEIYALPTFFVGHMSGEDWDVPWRQGRDFFTDPFMRQVEAMFVTTVVRALFSSPAVIGWVLSNELPNYASGNSAEEVAEWVDFICKEIRKIDKKRPISVGDGAWAPEIIGKNSNYSLRYLNRSQDFVGLHFYPRELSPWHHSFTAAFRLQMADVWGKPAIVEEFGSSTTLASEDNQAHYYRTVLYSSLVNGSRGILNWCLNDFDFENLRPYSHHLFEECFGIIRTDGSEKSAARVMDNFSRDVREITENKLSPVEHPIGLFIPSDYYYSYPYLFEPGYDNLYGLYLETFSLLKRANLHVKCLPEPAQDIKNNGEYTLSVHLDPKELPVLFIPRFQFVTKQFYNDLIKYIKSGGVVYFSYAINTWVKDWQQLAGVEADHKFGVPDFRNNDYLEIKSCQDWGRFEKDESFRIPLYMSNPEFSYAPILSTTAEILLLDQFDHPVLLRNSVGKGKVYFTPYPIEVIAHHNQRDDWKKKWINVYRSIADSEDQRESYFSIFGDGIEYSLWKSDNPRKFRLLLINHSWDTVQTEITPHDPGLQFQWRNADRLKKTETGYLLSIPGKQIFWSDVIIPGNRII